MSEHPHVQRIKGLYAAVAAKDLPTALAAFTPDAVFHVPGVSPVSGDHQGPAAIEKVLLEIAGITGGTLHFEFSGFFVDDRHVAVVTRETATRVADGATLDIPEVHLWLLNDDGAVVEFWDLPADVDIHDAFFAGR